MNETCRVARELDQIDREVFSSVVKERDRYRETLEALCSFGGQVERMARDALEGR